MPSLELDSMAYREKNEGEGPGDGVNISFPEPSFGPRAMPIVSDEVTEAQDPARARTLLVRG